MAESKDVTYLSTPIVEAYRDPPPIGAGMTREGYTKASGAPTDLMIRLDGEKKFRRLMIWQFSNIGTLFVRIGGKPHIVRDVPEAKPSEGPVALPRHRHHATRKYSEKASEKVARTMHEWKRGKLTSGSGGKVKSREQAIAIGLSQARAKGYKVPPSPSHATKKMRIAYWVRTRGGPRSNWDIVPVYVLGTTTRADEGLVGYDLRVRPLRLGKGPYTMVISPDDVEDKP